MHNSLLVSPCGLAVLTQGDKINTSCALYVLVMIVLHWGLTH